MDWEWAVSQGLIEGDPNYYISGEAAPEEVNHAVVTAYNAADDSQRKILVDMLWESGELEGDQTYWYTARVDEVQDLAAGYSGVRVEEGDTSGTGDGTLSPPIESGPPAIPRGSRLIRVGSAYRVIWDLPDGIGTVWYSISTAQLTQIYEDDWESDVTEVYSNEDSYIAKYGDLAWGNIAEVNMTAEDPWQDMYARILGTFGFVSGIETDEVRNLIVQAYFEGWTASEFLALYKDTEYYNSTTDLQREWQNLSETEKQARIYSRTAKMVDYFSSQFGFEPDGGLTNTDLLAAAEAVESGNLSMAEWEYTTKTTAATVDGSPAARAVVEETRAAGEQGVTVENLAAFAEDEWVKWMGGNVPVPKYFGMEWGNGLYMNDKSEADLTAHLKMLSSTYYPYKDPETTWDEWAAVPKSYVQNLLELPNVADDDRLLEQILSSGLAGHEMRVAIKNDPRYLETQGALSDMASKVSSIGEKMGFISGGSL